MNSHCIVLVQLQEMRLHMARVGMMAGQYNKLSMEQYRQRKQGQKVQAEITHVSASTMSFSAASLTH